MGPSDDDLRRWLTGVFGDTQVSDRVVDFHESFMPVYGRQYQELVENVSVALEEIPVHNPYFNDHGSRHTERILENLTLLLQEYDIELNPTEEYVTAAGAWLHDIGMSINRRVYSDEISIGDDTGTSWFREVGTTEGREQTIDDPELIRKWHHILSWNFVKNNHELLGFPSRRVNFCVAEICRAHRRRADTVSVNESETIDAASVRDEVRLRDAAALFQFADALDIGKERAPEISSYVQKLPEESQKHWDVCQLISSVDIDTDRNRLVVNASHSSEQHRRLLEEKAEHLYDEYDDVREILGAKPFELYINDVSVESNHRGASDLEIEISGREQYLETVNEVGETIRESQMTEFEDKTNKWQIEVLNESGDAVVARETTTTLLDETNSRTHFVRSFDNPMEWEWETDISVYDENETALRIDPVTDRPNNKRFAIRFPRSIDVGEEFTYTYEYNWDALFPQDEEIYIVTGNADRVEFEIDYPAGIEIGNVRCREENQNGRTVKEVDDGFKSGESHVSGMLEKESPLNEVHICWEVY